MQRITTAAVGCRRWDIPGDCLRAAVATVGDTGYDEVPHFALYPDWWWDLMRVWARQRGADYACVRPAGGSVRALVDDDDTWSGLVLASGPSPRGPYGHVVVTDADLRLVHDPHPDGAGLRRVDEVFILVDRYDPPPLALTLPDVSGGYAAGDHG